MYVLLCQPEHFQEMDGGNSLIRWCSSRIVPLVLHGAAISKFKLIHSNIFSYLALACCGSWCPWAMCVTPGLIKRNLFVVGGLVIRQLMLQCANAMVQGYSRRGLVAGPGGLVPSRCEIFCVAVSSRASRGRATEHQLSTTTSTAITRLQAYCCSILPFARRLRMGANKKKRNFSAVDSSNQPNKKATMSQSAADQAKEKLPHIMPRVSNLCLRVACEFFSS
jgi:hypothetical protein